MLKKILYALLLLLGLFLSVGLFLPRDFTVSRAIDIAAPASAIHEETGDLARWQEWTPWSRDNAKVSISVSQPSSGPGANLTWSDQSGTGKLTILASSPETGIDYELAFGESTDKAKASIHYQPINGGTRVEWRMQGDVDVPVVGGYFALLAEKISAKAYLAGLQRLKTLVEAQQARKPK